MLYRNLIIINIFVVMMTKKIYYIFKKFKLFLKIRIDFPHIIKIIIHITLFKTF